MSGSHEGHDCPNLEGKTADELKDMILTSAIDFAVSSRTYEEAVKKHNASAMDVFAGIVERGTDIDFASTLEAIAKGARAKKVVEDLGKAPLEAMHIFAHAAEAYALALGKVEAKPAPEPAAPQEAATSE